MIRYRAVALLEHLYPHLESAMKTLPRPASLDLEDAVTDAAFHLEHTGMADLLTAAVAPHAALAAAVSSLLESPAAPLQGTPQQQRHDHLR
jgi:hypothetical protein